MSNFEYPITLENFSKNVKYMESVFSDHEKCLQHSQKLITFVGTLNFIQQDKFRYEIKTSFLIGCKMIVKSINFDNSKEILSEYEKYTYETCLQYLDRVLEIEPLNLDAKNMYKVICMYLSKFDYMVEKLERLLEIHPCDYQLQFLLGILYKNMNDTHHSNMSFKFCLGIIDLELKSKEFNSNNIKLLKEFKVKCLVTLSEDSFFNDNFHLNEYFLLEALQVLPDDPDVHNKLGCVYNKLGEYCKAKKHFQIAMKHYKNAHISSPNTVLSAIHTNMAGLYFNENNYDLGVKSLKKALELDANMIEAYQNLLFNLHYILHTINDPMYLFEQHKNINTLLPVSKTSSSKQYIPNREILNLNLDDKNFVTLKRKIKIGFMSGEFMTNRIVAPVSFFINTILKNINFNIFEVICYSLIQLDSACDQFPDIQWKYITRVTTERVDEFKKIIENDKIDILFDLISHTSHSQIKLFSLKAAPIQISYCGYPNTSGLYSIDYHITDKYCDSDGVNTGPGGIVRCSTQKYYTEKLIFMDHCFLSYTPALSILPELEIEPFSKNKFLTLGSFNKLNKINKKVVTVWEGILEKCQNIKIAIKTKELQTQNLKEKFIELWKDRSKIERLIFIPYADTYSEHLEKYNMIDIALDTFPYSGTTTSCEALMMGVPVITLFDDGRQYHCQNVSSSLLVNSGLQEYICYSEDEYVEKVCYYANHLDKLIGLKIKIREKFLNGHVCDYNGFVEEFENKMLKIYKEHDWSHES